MEANSNSKIQVITKNQDMEAYIVVPLPADENYLVQDLTDALIQKGIVYGIDHDALDSIIKKGLYDKEILAAKGKPAIEGTDGRYELIFNRNLTKKPELKPDGAVDYWSLHTLEMVTRDQEIAYYYPAVKGEDGINTKGREVKAKLKRDLPPLKGKGFERSEDGRVYKSLTDGKIEMQNDRIIILPVYEIAGDADISVGHINFNGDLLIHGCVRSGVQIKVSGTVTIDGIVEGAQIEAGKDIILRSGVMGGSKSSVRTKGNIFAKFFEYATIEAEGDIQADIFMNCDVVCKGKVTLTGKKGSIVGGNIWAVQGVEVESIGNDVEVKTFVRVGNDIDVVRRIKMLQKKVFTAQENLDRIEKGLRDFEKLNKEKGIANRNDPRKAQLLRIKIKESANLSADKSELDKLERQVELAKGACLRVKRFAFPGVTVGIDDVRTIVKDKQSEVEFIKSIDKIKMYRTER